MKMPDGVELDREQRYRSLAMQLIVQLHGNCLNRQEAHTVARLLHELIDWQYAEEKQASVITLASLTD
jgi:hypothetical protein